MLKKFILFALFTFNVLSQVTMDISIIDDPIATRYIEYINNEQDGYFLDVGELIGRKLRVSILNMPPKAEWIVMFSKNLNQSIQPIGIEPQVLTNLIYFDLPLRATNYFFTIQYIIH